MTSTTPIVDQRSSSGISTGLWWFRELIATTTWLALFTKAFVFDFDTYWAQRFAPDYAWLVNFRFPFLLALFAFYSLLFGRKWFRSGLLYVALYPFVLLLWHLPRLLMRYWAVAIAFYPAVYGLFSTFRVNLIWFALLINAVVLIAAFQTPYLLYPAMFVVGSYLVRQYWLDFRRGFQQSSVFANLGDVIRKSSKYTSDLFIVKEHAKLEKLEPDSPAYKTQFNTNLTFAYILNSCMQFGAQKLKAVSDSHAFTAYLIATLMFAFLATVFGFSFIYWGLDKIDSSHFAGDTPVGFWAFTGFSLSTLLPSSIGHVEASSGIAQVVAHVESICSLLLIGIGFSFLFNSQRKQIRADLDQVLDEIGESAKALESHLGDTYQLKCEDLEDLLIEKSLVIVNLMRKMRGMEERRPLEEESNDAAGYIESEAGPALEAGPSPESPTDADTEQARP